LDENNNIINEPEEIIIGNHVWIGCRYLVLKRATINDGIILSKIVKDIFP
jgi:acetyltransferase-like isoleucine patch superfamily enzyme